jgi:flagellar biosynthesis/type III secretory pathway protein FliH
MQRELDADPEVMRSLVERALIATPLSGQVTVRVHPADLAALGDVTTIRPPVGSSFELVWVADAALLRGGCVVETPASVIDGRVDEALLDLFEKLTRD